MPQGLVDYSYDDFAVAGISAIDNTKIFIVDAASTYKDLKDAVLKKGVGKFRAQNGV